MGNSRVMFLGGISIVLGLFTLGLSKTSTTASRSADFHASLIQAEEIAHAGTMLGLRALDRQDYWYYALDKGFNSGTVTIDVRPNAFFSPTMARVYATSEYAGVTVLEYSEMKKVASASSGDRWVVVKRYTTTNSSEIGN